jgi:disulfide bond formation protein DsbB
MATSATIRQASASRGEAYSLGAIVLVAATGTILAALGFEYIGKYLPCPLCLQQRYAYYAGIPLAFLAMAMVSSGRARIAGLLFVVISLAFLANAGLGVYQSGAEWGWWPGPQSCGTMQAIGGKTGGLLDKLNDTKVIKCDEAQWRFALLSFAGWNAVVSLILCVAALKAAFAAAPRD